MKENNTYLKIGSVALLIALLLSIFYRPFIYRNNIYDYYFSDVIGSLFSVFTFCFLFWGFQKKKYSSKEKTIHILIATIIYAFIWEFMGFINVYGTFDTNDIYAGVLSGIITFLAKTIITRNLFSLKIVNYDKE